MRSCAMDGALTLQKGALRARSAERTTEKEKLKEKERERERERKKERKKESKQARKQESKKEKDSRASQRALVCFGRRALRALKYAPERRAHSALCREKDREREA